MSIKSCVTLTYGRAPLDTHLAPGHQVHALTVPGIGAHDEVQALGHDEPVLVDLRLQRARPGLQPRRLGPAALAAWKLRKVLRVCKNLQSARTCTMIEKRAHLSRARTPLMTPLVASTSFSGSTRTA